MVAVKVLPILTAPPPNVVVPVVVANTLVSDARVSATISPLIIALPPKVVNLSLATVNVSSKIAASSTLRVPLIVVVLPAAAILISPFFSIVMRSAPSVKNFNWSLSAPAVDSALI